jgi:hypothetical protein
MLELAKTSITGPFPASLSEGYFGLYKNNYFL